MNVFINRIALSLESYQEELISDPTISFKGLELKLKP